LEKIVSICVMSCWKLQKFVSIWRRFPSSALSFAIQFINTSWFAKTIIICVVKKNLKRL
jgi:hypothetical protein